jgi:hypothetical protein
LQWTKWTLLDLGSGFVAGLVLFAFVLSSAPAQAETDQDHLNNARLALLKDDKTGAGSFYAKIKPSSPLFSERLTDSLRWQFIQLDYQESWRITEIARRISIELKNLDYYTALAATKHGTCTLGFEVEDRSKKLLLNAYMYRFYNRFYGGNYNARPYSVADSGIQQQHLIRDQIQYLAAIPTATLLRRNGCRFFYKRFSSRKIAGEYEYASLNLFRELHLAKPSDQQFSIDDIEVRLIELAEEQKDVKGKERLLERYKTYKIDQWMAIEDQRRRYLWQKLIDQETILPGPHAAKSEKFADLIRLIKSRPPDEGLNWLAQVSWYEIPSEIREQLVDHLLNAEDPRYRAFLLTAKTELLYERGQMIEALALVRRLLLLGESDGDPEIERRVTYIAGLIFVEYAYSEKILGAIQNAVPAAKWNTVFRMVLLKHAVSGNIRGFNLMLKVMDDAGKKDQLQLDAEQMKFVTALAQRNFSQYAEVLQTWSKGRRPKANSLKILTDIAANLVPLGDDEFARIQDFTDRAALFLKNYLMVGEQQVRIQDLLLIYDRERSSEWSKGGVSVGASAVPAGGVDLRDDQPLPVPFTWNPPTRLALSDLLLVPDGAGSRGWILK